MLYLCNVHYIMAMKKKFLILTFVFAITLSCDNTVKNESVTSNKNKTDSEITKKDISKIIYTDIKLDLETKTIIGNWIEYANIKSIIDNIQKGDLSVFQENSEVFNETTKALIKNLPSQINNSPILVRINVLKTKFSKLESLVKLGVKDKKKRIKSIKELLVSFSNLNLQINKTLEIDNQNIKKP